MGIIGLALAELMFFIGGGAMFTSGFSMDRAMKCRQEDEQRAAEETLDGYAKILRDICRANDRIDDPVLPEKPANRSGDCPCFSGG